MDALNLFSAENLEGRIDVALAAGSTATAMFVYDLAPGQSSCPYHCEYEEEWLLVVDGTIAVRTPDGERMLGRGDHPDSDKIGIWPGEPADELVFERGTAVPWSQGEDGWEQAL
jgi:hypothetical protein